MDQFIKVGFYRKNLRIHPYLKTQHSLAKKNWNYRHNLRWWNPAKHTYKLHAPHSKTEWNIKIKAEFNTFSITKLDDDGLLMPGFRNCFVSKNPVTKWIKNIKKFETYQQKFEKDHCIH